MKKILINAISIKEGGGLVVLTKLLQEFCVLTKKIHWIVVVDESVISKIESSPSLTLLSYSWIKKTPFHLLWWYEFFLPKIIREEKVDFLFSQTNMLSFRKIPCPSVLLVHHAGYFSKTFNQLYKKSEKNFIKRMVWSARRFWVYNSVRKADQITVQTKALSDKIEYSLKIPNRKIRVIPHGPGLARGKIKSRSFPCSETYWKIGYITKFGVQKNFSVLFEVLYRLKAEKIKTKLFLTLDVNSVNYRSISGLFEKYDLYDCIENFEEIDEFEVNNLYNSLDLFVFPSLCESFGFTLIEAMYFGIPIIASDIPSNREILGEEGIFFSQEDSEDLFFKIIGLMNDERLYKRMSLYSINRAQCYQWKDAATNLLEVFCQRMGVNEV